jgi:hypothetical protein
MIQQHIGQIKARAGRGLKREHQILNDSKSKIMVMMAIIIIIIIIIIIE